MSELKNFLWGFPAISVLVAVGIYFSFKCKFLQFRCFGDIIRLIFKPKSSSDSAISNLAAVSTALGGTVGIGSITGVGLALATGGSGSIFWMWVSGLVGGIIKYAEVYVAVENREKHGETYVGGTMYCLKSMGKPKTAALFAMLTIAASFGVGNLTQSAAVSQLLVANGVSKSVSGAVFAIIIAFAVFGGRRSIAAINGKVIPIATLTYLTLMLYIIITSLPSLPMIFGDIFKSAFGFRQISGGVGGAMLASSMRTGFARGVFSCEAGMGSSPIAHAAADDASPHIQGLWGIFEVVVDIFVVSTITAIGLLALNTWDCGMMFRTAFGWFGSIILPLLLVAFAFASVISWCFYGETAIGFIFGKNAGKVSILFRLITVICAFVGAYITSFYLWDLSDIINALMIFPNAYMLFLKRKDIRLCHGI